MTDVSVVVPVFNHAHLLARAVRALSAQEHVSEIIVVNDCSTDNFSAVISQLRGEHQGIKLIELPQRSGPVRASNAGIVEASGRFLYLGAADDETFPHMFRKLLNLMLRSPDAPQKIVSGEVLLASSEGASVAHRPFVRPRNSAGYISPSDLHQALRKTDNWILTGAALVDRLTLLENGLLDESLGAFADSYAFRRVALQWGLHFLPEPVAQWNISNTGVSRSLANDWKNSSQVLNTAIKLMDGHREFPRWYQEVFSRRWWFSQLRISLGRNQEGKLETGTLQELLGLSTPIILAIAHMPRQLSGRLLLVVATIRLRPFGVFAVLGTQVSRAMNNLSRPKT